MTQRNDNVRDFLPRALYIAHLCLDTEFTFGTDFARDLGDFRSEERKLVNHAVDSIHEVKNLALYADACDLLRQITARDSCCRYRDRPHLERQLNGNGWSVHSSGAKRNE